uniref:DC1 domain-containing protein n=1 Tax=Daucus carota subsp. sativus TaxID=79200 RepID=A0A169WTE3_DAUCS
MKHFSHTHPLILSKYNHSPPNAVCSACRDPISSNTDFYQCIHQSIDSPCTRFLLHKACADLPMVIQHPLYEEGVLMLYADDEEFFCRTCQQYVARWFYVHLEQFVHLGQFVRVCIKCAFLERQLNHPSHSHPLTLLPMKATLHRCTACGVQEYDNNGVLCYLCSKEIVRCSAIGFITVLTADILHTSTALYQQSISRKDGNENDDMGDVEGSDLVHLPICDDEPYLFYQLIQQFANKFSISTNEESRKADIISECRSGHSLILFDNSTTESVVETNICDGCVQPLLSPPHPFYGCLDCNFFLHTLCATELPREIENRLTKFTRCYETIKGHPQAFNCELCSVDINPNFWFYYCVNCDTSFHALCVDQDVYSNIKYGGMVKDDNLHQHLIRLNGCRQKFKCAECGENIAESYIWEWNAPCFFSRKPLIQCASCEFFVCMECIISRYGSSEPRGETVEYSVDYNEFCEITF